MTKTVRAFVDSIEEGTAQLLFDGDKQHHPFPARLLPHGAREGSFVELTVRALPPVESAGEKTRGELARDDDGGDIKL